MNIISIGDLHGSKAWKRIDPEEWDQVIFMGDYVDSFGYSDKQIMENLVDVMRLKTDNPEKVVLLWGNHDVAYLFNAKEPHICSGIRYQMLSMLHKLFFEYKDLFMLAWQQNKYLWTHAGIVRNWYKNYVEKEIHSGDSDLAGTLNRLFKEYYLPLFHVGPFRGGGDKDSGPVWADYIETVSDPLPGYYQIVGHTHTRNGIIHYTHPSGNSSVVYTDCLDTKIEFHTLQI